MTATEESEFDGFQELVQSYVSGVPAKIVDFESAIAQKNIEQLEVFLHQLKGSAGGYGFEKITTLASESTQILGDSNELSSTVLSSLELLLEECRSLRTEDSSLLQ